MIALAKAGSVRLTTAPEQEARTTKAEDVVEIPLNLTLEYHRRAISSAMAADMKVRLQWLQMRDRKERSVWASKLRNTSLPLGKIIAETLVQRDNMWEPLEVAKCIDNDKPSKGSFKGTFKSKGGFA